jgi:hypothetical protein
LAVLYVLFVEARKNEVYKTQCLLVAGNMVDCARDVFDAGRITVTLLLQFLTVIYINVCS